MEKELSYFYKDKNKKDGYRTTCKECDSIVDKSYHQKVRSANKKTKVYSLENEVWKDVPDYNGKYQVSSLGRVKKGDKLLTIGYGAHGYRRVNLTKGKNELKTWSLHRLIAITFIPNPNCYPEINHKDENKNNNSVENLEWCTREYNCSYGNRNIKCADNNRSKQVYQYSKDYTLVKIWDKISDAERNGFCSPNIIACCKGKTKHHKNFIWSYEEL